MRHFRPSFVLTGILTLFASAALADSDLAAVLHGSIRLPRVSAVSPPTFAKSPTHRWFRTNRKPAKPGYAWPKLTIYGAHYHRSSG